MAITTGKKARKGLTNENVFKSIEALNNNQSDYLSALYNKEIIFAIGPAGTGKTYIASSFAAEQLYYKRINKIILTRPNVEAGPSLGYLPGSLDEKYYPYLVPYLDTFYDKLGKPFTDACVSSKQIEPIPIGFLRGRSFRDCVVIIDEAQNTTPAQMKLILSRIGQNCKIIIDGDTTQKDITGIDGLTDATKKLAGLSDVSIIRFTNEDIVRSNLCKQIILRYAKESKWT